MQNRASRTYQIRLIRLSIAQMMSSRKKPMLNQATGIKLRGQRRLMTFDVSETIVLSTRLWLKASHGRTLRSTERKSCRTTSRSPKEVQCAAVLTCHSVAERMQQATSIDKKVALVQSKRSSRTQEPSQTHIGRARKLPRHQSQIKAIIEALRSSTRLR